MGKKKVPAEASARGSLPLEARLTPGEIVSTVTTQVANAEACADFPNQPTVAAACTTLKGSLGAYATLVTNLSNTRALALTLESQRDVQVAAVRRDDLRPQARDGMPQPGRRRPFGVAGRQVTQAGRLGSHPASMPRRRPFRSIRDGPDVL